MSKYIFVCTLALIFLECAGKNNQLTSQAVNIKMLEGMLDKSKTEKEVIVLELGFKHKNKEENSIVYRRKSVGREGILLWDNGIISYRLTDLLEFRKLVAEIQRLDYEKIDRIEYSPTATYHYYQKDTLFIMTSVLEKSEEYTIHISGQENFIAPDPMISKKDLTGLWYRYGTYPGLCEFFSDGTLKFDVEKRGPITGRWKIKDRNIIIIYDEAEYFYIKPRGTPHSHSEKSEIISVWGFNEKELSGFMKKGTGKVRLVKYE